VFHKIRYCTQSDFTLNECVISGRCSYKSEAHLTVNFVSFGSAMLGVLEPKSFMSISAGLGAPTVLKKEQMGQFSASSIKFLRAWSPTWRLQNQVSVDNEVGLQEHKKHFYHLLEAMSNHWLDVGHSVALIKILACLLYVVFQNVWFQCIFLS
jgi:hypothetical protein